MKRHLIILLLVLIVGSLSGQRVKGRLEEVDGKQVLTLWGTHRERGYAHGYLLGEDFVSIFDEYIVKFLCDSSVNYYNTMQELFINRYSIEDKYQIEAEAMLQGMLDKGTDIYNNILERNLNSKDILICNAIPDLSQLMYLLPNSMGCASISSWGSSTEAELDGHLVITRLLDWDAHSSLYENNLLIVNLPSEESEQPWISFTFAGFLGALSGINAAQVGAFMHMGNEFQCQANDPYYPILLTIRNGIELDDYNQDKQNNPQDIVQAIKDRNRSMGSIVHAFQDHGNESPPLIIESNNVKEVDVRDKSDNTAINGSNLAATNHFRTLYSPATCSRYDGIIDSLNISATISAQRSWQILANAAKSEGNLQAIQYIGSKNLIKWSTTSSKENLAYSKAPTQFYLDSLFSNPAKINIEQSPNRIPSFVLKQNYPNPFNHSTTIEFQLTKTENVSLTIFNSLGEVVKNLVTQKLNSGHHHYEWNAEGFPSGIYFYQLQTKAHSQIKKLLLLK
ncbi:MAG: T9SS type A sorting domain-containing protein [Candidatus Marinimicrobia bacterium]|nr:T9SS type A sorting domain-containing protein [Candidatus Neomarinimicrobiota bacterium]